MMRTGRWIGIVASVLIAFGAQPCAAQYDSETAAATEAYQLIELLNLSDALTSEIAILRGQIEELIEAVDRTRQSQQRIASDFDTRLSQLESRPESEPEADQARITDLEARILQLEEALTAMHEVVAAATEVSPEKSEAEQMYESALNKYQAQQYDDAIIDLQAFLHAHTDDPATPGAHYWLAEALLQQGRYENAIETGQTLLTDYPQSEKAPATMFLLGKAYLELGDLAGAKEAWEDLVSIHPFSEPAYKAQGLLDQLP